VIYNIVRIIIKRVGQILIEVHAYITPRFPMISSNGPLPLLQKLELLNFRLYHKEGNFDPGRECCSEWSLIQRNWTGYYLFIYI
jgi:hypothetical protein